MKSPLSTLRYLLLLPLFALAVSCSDDDDNAEPTKEDLISRSWGYYQILVQESGVEVNILPFLDECITDDIQVFNKNGTYQWREGATKCDPADPDIFEEGTWELINNDSQLRLSAGGQTEVVELLEINTTNMIISYSDPDLSPDPIKVVFRPK